MTRRMQVYECRICGSIVKVWQQGGGGLTCCGAPLQLRMENRPAASGERQAALIDLSEVWVDGRSCWQFLAPGEAPEATCARQTETAREYGNLHGLWKA